MTAKRTARSPAHRSRSRALTRLLLLAVISVEASQLFALLFLPHPILASNVIQVLVPALAVAVCWLQSRRVPRGRLCRLWKQLAAAFLIWSVAQSVYCAGLFAKRAQGQISLSDALWLLFAFPLLLVASGSPQATRRDPVGWLDTAQAAIFFSTLFAFVYLSPGTISMSFAYDVQSLALILACALRYSVTVEGAERTFYRNLFVFAIFYSICSVGGYGGWRVGFAPGSLIDLCWTFPFSGFSALVLLSGRESDGAAMPRTIARWIDPAHLQAVSALGLTAMSLVSSGALVHARPSAGSITLIAAFLLFAARTSTREWQLHSVQVSLEHMVLHDPLTGLASRRMLQGEMTRRLALRSQEGEKRTAVLFIDIDRFKTINDALGHSVGDLLLRRIAGLLRSSARPQDLVARLGGDEFVILLDAVSVAEAEELAQRVIDRLRAPLTLGEHVVHVTASIGVVLGKFGASAESMLQDADCAMYTAKNLGRDRAQAFLPDMLTQVKNKLSMGEDLRRALRERSVEVYYQPIYGRGGIEIVGFEALARWFHEERGMVSPAEFIALAEDTGLIHDLGKQVLRRACAQLQEWNELFGQSWTVSVNVSAHQFAVDGLFEEVRRALQTSGLDPYLLKLEITESVLLGGFSGVEQLLLQLRALGVGVSLDDFGTGYSSLSYLLRLPFDVVKIDRSFVHHLDHDFRRAEMVRMVIGLAETLEMKIVAEGVETPEELMRLQDFHCDMVQGYLLSKPLSPEAMLHLLDSVVGRSRQLPAAHAPQQGRLRLPLVAGPLSGALQGAVSDSASTIEETLWPP